MGQVGPNRPYTVLQVGVGIVRRGAKSLKEIIGLRCLNQRIGVQLLDHLGAGAGGRDMEDDALDTERGEGKGTHLFEMIFPDQETGCAGPLLWCPGRQDDDDLTLEQLFGNSWGTVDGGVRWLPHPTAACHEDE